MACRCVYITGVDGSGKTTHAKALVRFFRDKGLKCRYVWLRFPHLLSFLILAYARLCGLTRYKMIDGYRHGQWEFYRSRLVSASFPVVLLIDTILFATVRLYIPLWFGYTIVCDRFIYDILVDTMHAVDSDEFHKKKIGRLFLSLIPHGTEVVLLDIDEEKIKERRQDLSDDFTLKPRKRLYRILADDLSLPVVTPEGSIEETHQKILSILKLPVS